MARLLNLKQSDLHLLEMYINGKKIASCSVPYRPSNEFELITLLKEVTTTLEQPSTAIDFKEKKKS